MAVPYFLLPQNFIHAITLWYSKTQREWCSFYCIVEVFVSPSCYPFLQRNVYATSVTTAEIK